MPISLLPLPGRLLEKIVHSKIFNFFEGHKILSEHQGTFRKGFSTTSTIADLTDDLFAGVNQGLTTLYIAAFIDLKKAFDTEILLPKLQKLGIRNTPLRWSKNYLSGRNQRTLANGITSGTRPVTCGRPQGSVLGRLFFLVYVNDLQSALDDCKIKLYADDSVLYQTEVNSNHADFKHQASMNLFSRWCSDNALTVTAKKTKIMAFRKCENSTRWPWYSHKSSPILLVPRPNPRPNSERWPTCVYHNEECSTQKKMGHHVLLFL